MQLFFNTTSTISYGLKHYSEWDYIRRGLHRNLYTVMTYYNSRAFSVRNNNFLVRLLNGLRVSQDTDLNSFYELTDEVVSDIAMHFGMTSSTYKGKVFAGEFYGVNNPEFIILDTTSFNPEVVHNNWKTISAVKPLSHPRSDLELLLPKGVETGSESGPAVISINLTKLAVQYRAFCLEQKEKAKVDINSVLTIRNFVHMFVLTNMLPAQLDIAIFNRLNNISKGIPLGVSFRKHAIAMPDYSTRVTKTLTNVLKDFAFRRLDYEEILKTVPMVTSKNLESRMVLPDIAPTRQVLWVEFMARLDTVDFMVRAGGVYGIYKNGTSINFLLKFFKRLVGDKMLQNNLPYGLFLDTKYKLEELLNYIKENR